jgi:hypothetical protein
VKKIKAETVKEWFAKAWFGESNVADNLEELSENIAAVSILCRGTFPLYNELCSEL